MSPALAGGFFTTEPPGKPSQSVSVSHSVASNSLRPHGLWPTRLCPWDPPGKNSLLRVCYYISNTQWPPPLTFRIPGPSTLPYGSRPPEAPGARSPIGSQDLPQVLTATPLSPGPPLQSGLYPPPPGLCLSLPGLYVL